MNHREGGSECTGNAQGLLSTTQRDASRIQGPRIPRQASTSGSPGSKRRRLCARVRACVWYSLLAHSYSLAISYKP
ncbi:hypothetical protein FA13DRAFT_1102969 [Coprinellus micaceus]|uniref:Uncharacterized protein n=1 Tax=Coprinellus micaceus TaxID=71717 RepID=A0A4Y7SYH6_COPMI|nr:hypothetical protein FA13DRAFT_1102969 [Coprinellus micaceus]